MIELASGDPDMPLEAAAEAAISWLARSDYLEATIRKYANEVGRFLASSRCRGAATVRDLDQEMVLEYLDEAVFRHRRLRSAAANTRRWRLTAIRKLFAILRTIGVAVDDPTRGITSPERVTTLTRPFTDGEMVEVRNAAYRTVDDTREPAIVAIAEAGGKTNEIARVAPQDINLVEATIRLGQGRRRRTNAITPWGVEALSASLARHAYLPHDPLAVQPTTQGYSATSSVGNALMDVYGRAGLLGDPLIRVESARAWSGRHLYEVTGDLIACARWLGLDSLDTTAVVIGLAWREG